MASYVDGIQMSDMSICDYCHEEKDSTCWRLDPYVQDVDGEEIEIFVCDECEDRIAEDI